MTEKEKKMKDTEFINRDNLSWYCNTNETLLEEKPEGIVMEFPGLGGSSCLGGSLEMGPYVTEYAAELAKNRLLLVYTFPGPWSWMNRGAVRMCDLICTAAMDKYGLRDGCPLVATGGSMGGMGALIWTADTCHRVTAVAAACPGYDQLAVWDKLDFPRTYMSSACCYDGSIEEALRHVSPVYRTADFPDLPYYIVGDGEDECFPIDGMDAFVEKMREAGKNVTYRRLDGLKHGEFTPECRGELTKFVISNGKLN